MLPAVDTIWQLSVMEVPDDGDFDHLTHPVSSYNRDTLRDGFRRLAEHDGRVVFHAGTTYDVPVIKLLTGTDLRAILGPNLIDTLVLSRLGNPEKSGGHSIESWGGTAGVPKVVHSDWTQWSPAMEHRCEIDVRISAHVWKRLRPMLKRMPVACSIEHETAYRVFNMCQRGIHFNTPLARDVLDEFMCERETALEVSDRLLPTWYFPKTKKSFEDVPYKVLKNKPNRNHWGQGILDPGVPYTEVRRLKLEVTRDDIALYLKRTYKWKPTQRTKTGKPQVDDEVLRGLPWEEAQAFADYFKVDKVIGYMNSEIQKNGRGGGWLHHVTNEGKLHAGFIPLTAVTGRPSCVAPNLQQVPTDGRVRQLFIPRPGWKLVGVDADGQELRCLGHYLYPYDGGEYAREVDQGDIHSRVQKLIGFHTRDGTKPAEYGLIYGAGNPKLGLIALQDALSVGKTLNVSLGTRGKQIRAAIMSGITGFEALLNDVRIMASNRRRLRGLDGRTLWVRSPHSALNLLLQSAGIIHMKQAISIVNDRLAHEGLVEDKDYGLVLWVHDELQFEAHPDVAEVVGETAAKAISEAGEMLKFRLPMPGTAQVGNNWKETH